MRFSIFLLTSLVLTLPLSAQTVWYNVSFPNAVHHEAEISVTFTDLQPGRLELRMSRSSPGRYALHEFAKNVYSVRAVSSSEAPLEVTRPNPYQWDVSGHNGVVTVSYTLFADRGGGTYSQVDETHAHLNIPATFMWARGLDDRDISVTFSPPEGSGWRAATQLFPTDQPMTFIAPNLQYFMDSPTELSDFALREWTVPDGDSTSTIRLAVHHDGTEAEVDDSAEMVRKVVDQEIAVFGEPAGYDRGTYTFIADYLPHVSGDGMEHRNSTILASTSSLAQRALGLLGTVSHEFFHSWNVERIRPRALQPFDFERANMSDALWFAEGFTSYYTPLFIRRAGLTSDDQFAGAIGGGISFVVNSPARGFFSPMEMSMQAPFVDAATAVDPTNRGNTFISYYTWGSVIGLNLDLTLRSQFDLKLDDYMRTVWQRFGKTEIPYTIDDLEATLAQVTGDVAFATEFFARYVRDSEVPDYEVLLGHAGLLLRPARPEAATLGVSLIFEGGAALVTANPLIGSPAYEAGVSRGDGITRIDGQTHAGRSALNAWLATKSPGDVVEIELLTRSGRKTVMVTLGADTRLEVVTYESAGLQATSEMREFRQSWLGWRE